MFNCFFLLFRAATITGHVRTKIFLLRLLCHATITLLLFMSLYSWPAMHCYDCYVVNANEGSDCTGFNYALIVHCTFKLLTYGFYGIKTPTHFRALWSFSHIICFSPFPPIYCCLLLYIWLLEDFKTRKLKITIYPTSVCDYVWLFLSFLVKIERPYLFFKSWEIKIFFRILSFFSYIKLLTLIYLLMRKAFVKPQFYLFRQQQDFYPYGLEDF